MNFDPQPNLATSWTISPDGLTYTFTLVDNATFHDGKPVTSADVKFTMEEVVKKYSPWGSSIFDCVDHVETPDNYTVAFKLKYPFATFMTVMNFNYFAVLPKHLYEGTDIMTNPYNTDPVGSGPYKFVEWVRGDHVTLTRYDDYFKKDKPYIDRIVYRIPADEATADTMLDKGELDYISCKILPQDVDRLRDNPNLVVDDREYTALSVLVYLFMNCKEGHITADPDVRRAIAMAINKTRHLDLIQLMQGKLQRHNSLHYWSGATTQHLMPRSITT
jgi:peptide/nickel transport system substrate-binding protein